MKPSRKRSISIVLLCSIVFSLLVSTPSIAYASANEPSITSETCLPAVLFLRGSGEDKGSGFLASSWVEIVVQLDETYAYDELKNNVLAIDNIKCEDRRKVSTLDCKLGAAVIHLGETQRKVLITINDSSNGKIPK